MGEDFTDDDLCGEGILRHDDRYNYVLPLKEFHRFLAHKNQQAMFSSPYDLEAILDKATETAKKGLENKALFPYINFNRHIKNICRTIQDNIKPFLDKTYHEKQHMQQDDFDDFLYDFSSDLQEMGFTVNIANNEFNFNLNRGILSAVDFVSLTTEKENVLENLDDDYKKLEDEAEDEIGLKTFPNMPKNETVFFGLGKMIFPVRLYDSEEDEVGYHIYSFQMKVLNDDDKINVRFENQLLNENPIYSLKRLMKTYCSKNALETVVLAKNSEKFPLYNTSIPLTKKKYVQEYFKQMGY